MSFFFKWKYKIRIGYFIVFIVLILSYIFTTVLNKKLQYQTKSDSLINKTVVSLGNILLEIKETQVTLNDYMITNNKYIFQQYLNCRKNADSLLNYLYQSNLVNLSFKKNLDSLGNFMNSQSLSNSEQSYLSNPHNSQLLDTIRILTLNNSLTMDNISKLINNMQINDENIVRKNRIIVASFKNTITIVNIIILIVTLFLAVFAVIVFNKENKGKREANSKANAYFEQLELRVDELTKMNKEIVQLKSLEKFTSVGRIANSIAHEIKNPLTNINLAITQLSEEFHMDKSNLYIKIIERNTEKIQTLVNDFINTTKFSELTLNYVSINDLIDEVLILATDRIHLQNIKVKKNYSPDICNVSVDVNKIKTAFLNIILNAIEAMEPQKGILKIDTLGRETKCIVTITDNGTGMDKDILNKLFEPYFSTKPKGNGLGLTQAQNVILNHQGTIEVESEPGEGTKFTIFLNFSENPA